MHVRWYVLTGVAVYLISFGGTAAYYQVTAPKTVQPPTQKQAVLPGDEEETNEPKTQECPINGKMMTEKQKKAWETRRPLGVMIENHVQARPQSGLNAADVVYEAVAEGGITRFLAVYYCQDAPFIGPIRSARVHFMTLLQEYGEYPLYAHVGGANCDPETGSGCANGAKADALGLINKLGWGVYNDLNQFGVPFPYFWRDYERLPDRDTEHTVYSSTKKLWDFAKLKRDLTEVDEDGVRWDESFDQWKFTDDAAAEKRGSVAAIKFGFWDSFASQFAVQWKYTQANNTYVRLNGGAPHMDKNTNKQLSAKNVVVVFSAESPANDGYAGGHILYKLTGSGDALVFQNGNATKATWKKATAADRMRWYDESGKEITMVRGKVFVHILPIDNKVEYEN